VAANWLLESSVVSKTLQTYNILGCKPCHVFGWIRPMQYCLKTINFVPTSGLNEELLKTLHQVGHDPAYMLCMSRQILFLYLVVVMVMFKSYLFDNFLVLYLQSSSFLFLNNLLDGS
jgi:hypothetical protein